MEEKQSYKTPKSLLLNMQISRLGKIFFNLQFAALAVMIASVVSFMLPVLYYITVIAIYLLTLFTILAWYPPSKHWMSNGETLIKIAAEFTKTWKYTVPCILALSAAAIVLLCLDRNEKHTPKIVISAVIAALAIIVLILKLINKGGV